MAYQCAATETLCKIISVKTVNKHTNSINCIGQFSYESGEVSQIEGEVDALSSFDADQLSLLLRLRQAGSDGVRPRGNLDEEIFTCC